LQGSVKIKADVVKPRWKRGRY